MRSRARGDSTQNRKLSSGNPRLHVRRNPPHTPILRGFSHTWQGKSMHRKLLKQKRKG
jgi:hypothetical protein